MAFITLTTVKLNDVAVSLTLSIEASAIKYVLQHTPTSAYDEGKSEVFYYDEQAAKLTTAVVTETAYDIYQLYYASDPHFILATAEQIAGMKVRKPLLFNDNSVGYQVPLSSKDSNSISVVVYSGLAGGDFTGGDTITGSVSMATALVLFNDENEILYVHPIKGTLSALDVITSSDGVVTANVDSYTATNQKFIQLQEGLSQSQVKKDIVAMVNNLSTDRAITGASAADKTFTIAGDHAADFTKDVPFFVDGSTDNDGLYSVVSSVYGSSTVITVGQSVVDSGADGTIKFD